MLDCMRSYLRQRHEQSRNTAAVLPTSTISTSPLKRAGKRTSVNPLQPPRRDAEKSNGTSSGNDEQEQQKSTQLPEAERVIVKDGGENGTMEPHVAEDADDISPCPGNEQGVFHDGGNARRVTNKEDKDDDCHHAGDDKQEQKLSTESESHEMKRSHCATSSGVKKGGSEIGIWDDDGERGVEAQFEQDASDIPPFPVNENVRFDE